jgi:hypothetical protein
MTCGQLSLPSEPPEPPNQGAGGGLGGGVELGRPSTSSEKADPDAVKNRNDAKVTVSVQMRHACPDCGSTAPKEDNDLPQTDPEYSLLCPDCGESWSPNL